MCDFGDISTYIAPFIMVVYQKTDFEALKNKQTFIQK